MGLHTLHYGDYLKTQEPVRLRGLSQRTQSEDSVRGLRGLRGLSQRTQSEDSVRGLRGLSQRTQSEEADSLTAGSPAAL